MQNTQINRARSDRQYICQDCRHRGNASQFGLFVRCPACESARILDAEIWDRFGLAGSSDTPLPDSDTS